MEVKSNFTIEKYPLLANAFSRPALLKSNADLDALSKVIAIKDPEYLGKVSGRNKIALATAWLPLIIHNILNGLGGNQEDLELQSAMLDAESKLRRVAQSPWCVFMRRVSRRGVTPKEMHEELSFSERQELHAEKKEWEKVILEVEVALTPWLVGSVAKLTDEYQKLSSESGVVSLKKLAKFGSF